MWLFKTYVSIFRVISFNAFWNFYNYGLEIQHGIFMVLNFGGGICLGFAGSPRDFFRF